MSPRRWRKIIGLSILVALLLVSAVATIVLIELPSVRELYSSIVPIHRPVRAPASFDGDVSPLGDLNPTDVREGGDQAIAQRELITGYLVQRYLQEDSTDVRVCEDLAEIQDPPIRDRSTLADSVARLASGEARENPFPEAVLAPIGYVLRRPEVTSLAQQLLNAQAIGGTGFVEPVELQGQLAAASADMFSNKAEVERISQHAYHLYVISRVIQMRPDLANNLQVASLCSQIETSIEQPPSPEQPIDLNREKAAMLRFLAFAGLAPDQVGYDPNLNPQIVFSASPQKIVLRIPWMEKAFGGLPEIRIHLPAPSPTPP